MGEERSDGSGQEDDTNIERKGAGYQVGHRSQRQEGESQGSQSITKG